MPRYEKRRVSYSQVEKAGRCARQLMYYRDGEPEKFKGIAPIQGTAVHVGCQHFVQYHDLEAAIDVAILTLFMEITEVGEDNVIWDEPVRLTQGWWDKGWWDKREERWIREPGWKVNEEGVQSPRPYKGDEGNMSNLAEAEALTRAMVTAWAVRFPNYKVTPLAECPVCGTPNEDLRRDCSVCDVRLAGIERKMVLPLTPFGIAPYVDPETGEKIPWELVAVLDMETDCDAAGTGPGGVIDLKISKQAWTKDDAPQDGELSWDNVSEKDWFKRLQAYIYLATKLDSEGMLPPWFHFINIPRTGVQVRVSQMGPVDWNNPREAPFIVEQYAYDPAAIQAIPVDYDPAAVEDLMRYRVQPTIDAIVAWEAGREPLANTNGWWCSARFCAYWELCPLGAAARGGAKVIKLEEKTEAVPGPVQGAA